MKSLQIAVKKLRKENLTFILVKEGVVLKKSKDLGLHTLLHVFNEENILLEGAAVADRVVGKAAALLLRDSKVIKVHGEVMSEEALKILEEAGIEVSYEELVPNILNRDRTDLCPLEKMSLEIESGEDLADKINDRLGA